MVAGYEIDMGELLSARFRQTSLNDLTRNEKLQFIMLSNLSTGAHIMPPPMVVAMGHRFVG